MKRGVFNTQTQLAVVWRKLYGLIRIDVARNTGSKNW